jgi:hypothetical protein
MTWMGHTAHMGDNLGKDGKIILRWILKKQGMKVEI